AGLSVKHPVRQDQRDLRKGDHGKPPRAGRCTHGAPASEGSGTDREFQRPVPLLGEHTWEILASMPAIDENELDTLGRDDVI
ncbi:MAG TPA: hypothetical protein DEV64_04165, partial [Rhodospirillaceae bacterium]|nr:hypothetical protein [Rhodospirillaceae bacterium]